MKIKPRSSIDTPEARIKRHTDKLINDWENFIGEIKLKSSKLPEFNDHLYKYKSSK